MNVVFRVDASNIMGTGHAMRCLTLADVLRQQGASCYFVHRRHSGHMIDTIRDRGHAFCELPPPKKEAAPITKADYSQWLGVTQEQDTAETIAVLNGLSVDWLVVDQYGLDVQWEKAMRPHARNIAVIDDLANRSHDCDLLVDQNFFPDAERRYDSLLSLNTKRLCGPRYALLRPQYAAARRLIAPRRGPLSRVLVFYGGTDITNETGRALRVLSRPAFRHLAVDVVIGANNRHRAELMKLAETRPITDVHAPREHLVDLMIEADLSIGAGGTTTWERCALGLPSLVTAVAENQIPFNEALSAAAIIQYLGRWTEITDDLLAETLLDFLDNKVALRTIAAKAWRVTDGLGVLRVAEAILPNAPENLTLRPAGAADKAIYFEWANNQITRRSAHNPARIPWPEHDSWFEARLCDRNTHLWVMTTPHGLPVGQVRVEATGGDGLLDYSIDPAFRGRGWGVRLLELTVEAWRDVGGKVSLKGEVLSQNQASRQAFLRAGQFEEEDLAGGGGGYSLTILSDRTSWISTWIPGLLAAWLTEGHRVRWVHSPGELTAGDFCFFLGCGQLVRPSQLALHRHNLVVHESDLPHGRGWSPLTWQVLEGKSRIPVTMLEGVEGVDAGVVYLQEWFELTGHELIDELRVKQAEASLALCRRFVDQYPSVIEQGRIQEGEPTWYSRRTEKDSELNPDKSVLEQFNLLRVVDNERYPAFFIYRGWRYKLAIEKLESESHI